MRVAVTGAHGRLGRALLEALVGAPYTGFRRPIPWSRPDFELDTLTVEVADRLLARDGAECVVHAAAWTDVDGCAREPDLALRRNGQATGALAEACARRGVDLVVISTNEVFDGRRTDGKGYGPDDPVAPINPYGASKLEGEALASQAFERAGGDAQLAIVRTAWLFGPPGNDFPAKILAAARRSVALHVALKAVVDETGSPTYTRDLAEAIAELIGSGELDGMHHVVNGDGAVSRADWARAVLELAGVSVPIDEVPAATWQRASTPPQWAVLEPSALPSGEPLRPWRDALAEHVPTLLRGQS